MKTDIANTYIGASSNVKSICQRRQKVPSR